MDILKLKLPELKKMAKEQGIKGYSTKKKAELLELLKFKIKVKKTATPKTATPKTVTPKTVTPKTATPKTVTPKTTKLSEIDEVVDELKYNNFDFGNYNSQLQDFSNKAHEDIVKKTKKEGSRYEVNFLTRFLPKPFLEKAIQKYGLKFVMKKLYEFATEEMQNEGIDRDAVFTPYKLANVSTKNSMEYIRIIDKEGADTFG